VAGLNGNLLFANLPKGDRVPPFFKNGQVSGLIVKTSQYGALPDPETNPLVKSILRLRVVWVQTDKELLRLVTNLGPEELSAGEVALLYKERWRIELFFRWLKCILGCRHWLAESPQGVALQIYLALIAALLLQLYTGQRPTKRMMELIQFYLLGVASLDELCAGLERLAPRQKS
jgi:IS4 transposase